MTTRRLLAQAVRSMARYRLRTGFMMLGSLVGVAALVFVVSLGRVAEAKLLRTVRQIFGDASVLVVGGGSRLMGGAHGSASRLTLDDMAAVAREVPEIAVWDPQSELTTTVRHGDATATVRVLGQSERWQRAWARGVVRGQSFDAAAVAGSARVALIGATAARALFGGEDPIDAEIRIGAVPFRVIGVLETFGTDMHGMDRDDEIVVPISTLMRRLANTDAITAARVLLSDPSRQGEAARAIRRVLRDRHAIGRDRPDDFRVVTAVSVQRNVAMVQRILLLYLPLAGGIVLLVGGIVAATLMLASVAERVPEIGLRRAVGARPEDIRTQFLMETAATVVAGGAAGLLLGGIAVRMVGTRMQLDATLSWPAVAVAVVASAAGGLLAGVAPAQRAARLDPVEALR